jgi:biotin operon repressor
VLDDFAATGRITTTEFAVYVALCRFANNQGEAWPSAESLGHKVGLSERAARRAIGHLEAVGLIAIERRQDELGRSRPSVYVLLEPSDVAHGPDTLSPYPDRQSAPRGTGWPGRGATLAPEQDLDQQDPENKNGSLHKMTIEERERWLERRRAWLKGER